MHAERHRDLTDRQQRAGGDRELGVGLLDRRLAFGIQGGPPPRAPAPTASDQQDGEKGKAEAGGARSGHGVVSS
jgi:hypothetical protein